nr:MAG TPA: hypothetical protein [Caudoviricetes sp.]
MTNKDYDRLTFQHIRHGGMICGVGLKANSEEVAERLYALENAIENGTLVFLPYRTGQKFWWIYHSPVGVERGVESETICKVEIFKDNLTIITDSGLLFNDKDVFTTKEEAEKALEELKK